MELEPEAIEALLLRWPVARLVTLGADGAPAPVPIVFAHAFLQTKTGEVIASLEMAFVKFLNVLTERQAAQIQSRRALVSSAQE